MLIGSFNSTCVKMLVKNTANFPDACHVGVQQIK
jgi:hypothetical protein